MAVTGAGKAVDIDQGGTVDITLTQLSSSGSASEGVHLQGLGGSFSAAAGTITGSTGTGVLIGASGGGTASSGGNLTFTYGGAITNAGGSTVEIQDRTGGTVTFSGALSDTAIGAGQTGVLIDGSAGTIAFTGPVTLNAGGGAGAGVRLANNTATINFNPTGTGLDITTASGAGFTATGGGTVTVTGAGNTISSGTGTALTVSGTTIGAGDLVFQSISANGGVNGIVLNATGATGGLTVTGTGTTAGSGGTIQNSTGSGILLTNTSDVSLSNMDVKGALGQGLHATSITNISLVGGRFTDNDADAVAITGVNVRFDQVHGTAAITNTVISGAAGDQLRLENTSGSLFLNVDGSTFGAAAPTNIGNGVTVFFTGTAQLTATVDTSTFTGNRASGFLTTFGDTASFNIAIRNSLFQNNNNGADIGLGRATSNFTLDGNQFYFHGTNAINIVSDSNATNAAVANGVINNNIIGNGTVNSGSAGAFGISVDSRGDIDATIAITNNTIRNQDNSGIFIQSRLDNDGDGEIGRLDVTVTGNTIGTPEDNTAFPFGFLYTVLIDARNSTVLTADISGNTFAPGVGGAEAIRIRQRDSASFRLERLTDGDATPNEIINTIATIEGRLLADNPATATADTLFVAGITEAANGAARHPVIPALPAPLRAISGGSGFAAPITDADIASLLDAAIARWAAVGATEAQLAAMRGVAVSVADLGGLRIGESTPGAVVIDDDAAGWGWFVDGTPGDDAEFSGAGAALEGGAAAGRMDLLTALMHELGHQVGLDDHHDDGAADALMYGFLDVGERRLPELDHLDALAAASDPAPSAGLTGWVVGSAPEAEPAPEAPGVEGWIDGVVLEAETGGLDALLAGFAPAPADAAPWDAGAVLPDPLTTPPLFEPGYGVL